MHATSATSQPLTSLHQQAPQKGGDGQEHESRLRPPTCHKGAIAASSTMPFLAHLRSKGHKRECDGGLRRTADVYGATVGVVHSDSCDQTD